MSIRGRAGTAQPSFVLVPELWIETKDGDPSALSLYERHYSCRVYADGRDRKLLVGPGEKMVLLTACARALFAWRKFISGDGQVGINCSVFRNESEHLASDLISAADELAFQRWPGERHYTYVDSTAVRSSNPGYCFLMAGWQKCGRTKKRDLIVLERLP